MIISYNDYYTYKQCPFKYWNQQEVRAGRIQIIRDMRNAFIGIILQKIGERFYKAGWWKEGAVRAQELMLEQVGILCRDTKSSEYPWQAGELEKWRQIALETIPKMVRIIQQEKLLGTIANKAEFNVWYEFNNGADRVNGRLDYLIHKPNALIVLDGKGGAQVGKYVDPDQLHFYGLGVRNVYGKAPTRLGFWWFRHERIVDVNPTLEAAQSTIISIEKALKGIKEGDFTPSPNPECRLCDFRSKCISGQQYLASKVKDHGVSETLDLTVDNIGEISL